MEDFLKVTPVLSPLQSNQHFAVGPISLAFTQARALTLLIFLLNVLVLAKYTTVEINIFCFTFFSSKGFLLGVGKRHL
ncbi:hypothetical protein Q3G72_031245 [Acer saccharum]|nr:hypothetical protein Q3G72_031245 [Acer saccharum]